MISVLKIKSVLLERFDIKKCKLFHTFSAYECTNHQNTALLNCANKHLCQHESSINIIMELHYCMHSCAWTNDQTENPPCVQ